jgi:hypothetical protein
MKERAIIIDLWCTVTADESIVEKNISGAAHDEEAGRGESFSLPCSREHLAWERREAHMSATSSLL